MTTCFRQSGLVSGRFATVIAVLVVLLTLVGTADSRRTWSKTERSSEVDITNGIQTYSTLTDTTVNMTGRSELHVTAAVDPIPGCLINLNSSDAWFFLEGIQPSLVVANHLGQIQVNGEAAVLNSNVRVVEYVMGTVVIPHSSSYLPLEVFTERQFTGSSMQLGLYTYYRGEWTHVAVTIDGAIGNLYVNGTLVAATDSIRVSPAAVRTKYNYLGKSQYPADPLFAGQLEQAFFADYALTDSEVSTILATLPPRSAALSQAGR